MKTDTSEKGLESLIVRAMTGRTELVSPPCQAPDTATPVAGDTGWLLGDASHYDREHGVDLVQLRDFLQATQEQVAGALSLHEDGPTRQVAVDSAYQNARQNSDRRNARNKHDKALVRVMTAVLKDDTELFKLFSDNERLSGNRSEAEIGLTSAS
jgi:hypothetical protein